MSRSITRRGLLGRGAAALGGLLVSASVAVVAPPARAADAPVSELTADNLLLIVNQNDPAGERLAAFYADQR